jgi:origin recognition complex subunit 6
MSTASNSAIVVALLSLLPKYAANPSAIPPPLLTLSETLLAQSRQRAAHLKNAEEIGRTYACCHIACTRLRAKLRLPALKEGGSGCNPAVYKRLLAFLEKALSNDGKAQTSTPGGSASGKKRSADGQVKNGLVNGKDSTPSKGPSRPQSTTKSGAKGGTFLGKIKASKKAPNTDTEGEPQGDGNAPNYTMPMVRTLCRAFSTPSLAPHVYTGICVILKLDSLWPPDEDEMEEPQSSQGDDDLKWQITGLVIAVYCKVVARACFAAKQPDPAIYTATTTRAAELFDYDLRMNGVSKWIRRIKENKYAEGQDWFISVPLRKAKFDPGVASTTADHSAGSEADSDEDVDDLFRNGHRAESEDEDGVEYSTAQRRMRAKRFKTHQHDHDQQEEEDDPEGVLLPGLHTMMQEALDFLNEERTRKFQRWRKEFLSRLDRLDKVAPSAAGAAADGKRRNTGKAKAA